MTAPADRPSPSRGRQLLADAAASLDAVSLGLVLEQAAQETGDNRLRRAAQFLQGRRGGRPSLDDDDALATLERLMRDGKPAHVALGIVACRVRPCSATVESVKHRLRRKLRKKFGQNRFCPS